MSGIGDISFGGSYGKYLEEHNTYLDFNLTAKMPTGDTEASDEVDGWEQTIPLGTDTWDFSGAFSVFYFLNELTFKGTFLYKMNGEVDNTYTSQVWDDVTGTWINKDVTTTTDIGDLLLVSFGADYALPYRLTAGLKATYGNHMASETDGTDNKNGLSFMDLVPTVKYPISLFEFVGGAKIPVMTSAESHDPDDPWSNQENRNPVFFFRTNYRIF